MTKLKILLFFAGLFIIGLSSYASAQTKVGYIDSRKIIDAMQESKDAKTRLDNQVGEWQTELTRLQDSLKIIKDDYEKKRLILTDQLKTQFEGDITRLEDAIQGFKVQKFGENGEYFQKQVEFMKPVQDRIFLAIEKVAKEEGFDYVFDRSSEILLLYVNEKYDLTAKVQRIVEGK